MKTEMIIILIISIFLLISLSGCITENDKNNNDWWEKEIFYYRVEIVSNNSENYSISLPVPLISVMYYFTIDNYRSLSIWGLV